MADADRMTPDVLSVTLANILECACAALTANGSCGCPCRSYVSVGETAWDQCCDDGQLTVTLDRLWPMGNFPQAAVGPIFCQQPLAADITVLLLRCAPSLHDDGSAPTAAELAASASKMLIDAYVLEAGLICCLMALKREQKFAMSDTTFVGPRGGCVGVQLKIRLEISDPPAF